jgi:hypothetical protein
MSSRLHSIRSCISHRIITLTFIRFEVGACTVERGSRTEQFTQSGVATGVGYNPFFGFYQFGVPTTEILGSYSLVKPGVNGGAGLAFGSKWSGKFYAEARYNRICMNNNLHTDYVPATFGFRW